jgi:hypothetical protein
VIWSGQQDPCGGRRVTDVELGHVGGVCVM